MSPRDELKRELQKMLNDATELLRLLTQKDFQAAYADFVPAYQVWYTKAIKIVATLATDRLLEFTSYYEADAKRKSFDASTYSIQDYVKGIGPTEDVLTHRANWDALNVVRIRIATQREILASVSSRIDGVLADIEAAIASELEDTTLSAAQRLVNLNLRAAGALAGVVLEEHLSRVASGRGIKVGKANPTIGDMNDALKQGGIYDVPAWRRIQFLADIRNICAHKKGVDPTQDQVSELLNGVNWVVKNIQ